MFEALKRLQLQKRGMSCGRIRRKQSDSEVMEILRFSPWVKASAFFAFFVCLSILVTYKPVRDAVFLERPLQAMAVIAVVLAVAVVQFFANHPNSFRRNSRVTLIFGLILLQLVLVKVIGVSVRSSGIPEQFAFLLMPYALGPLALSVLLGRTQGIFVAVFGSLWGCLLVPVPYLFPFLVTSLVTGFVAVYVTNQVRKRSRLVRAGVYVGITGLALTAAVGFISLDGVTLTEMTREDWRLLGLQVFCVLLVGTFTATVVSGTLPVLESLFRVTTDISWIELADLNHPLLKRMTIEAPGTYHQSLVVANLSEAAAECIGANPTMCRVCSYFHDIGKLAKPEYYIENISEEHNPHDDLTPTMSALVIISHVKDGIDLALKHKLSSEILHVIEQHHGSSLIYFFYRRALDQQENFKRQVEDGNANEEDIPEVDPKNFRYPGPKPQFRESAIISLADAVEGASRTLAKPTPAKISQLIEEIVQSRIRDGQLDECDLTFAELEAIKKSFQATLRSMLHNRVAYPKATDDRRSPEEAASARDPEQGGGGTRRRKGASGGVEVARKGGGRKHPDGAMGSAA
ncbi:hypothetical protein BH23VER1_BH23VER1_12210 [soil metagenome]